MKRIILTACLLSAFLTLSSCAPFSDSPFSDQLLTKERSLNEKAQEKLRNIDGDGKLRIAVLADAHQNYGALDKVIYDINQLQAIDFVVNLGDFTNSGYNLEYDQYIDSFTNLRHPGFTVIGNHDSIGAGPHLFKKAFSGLNYFFESSSKRFIFFNSANLEAQEEFSAQWLKDAVDGSSKSVIIFTHCDLRDPERFTGDNKTILDSVINDSKVVLVMNGHNHVYHLDNQNGTVLLQVPRAEGENFMVVEIKGTQFHATNTTDGTDLWLTLKN